MTSLLQVLTRSTVYDTGVKKEQGARVGGLCKESREHVGQMDRRSLGHFAVCRNYRKVAGYIQC